MPKPGLATEPRTGSALEWCWDGIHQNFLQINGLPTESSTKNFTGICDTLMSESESTDLDRDVDASMRMFEKSKVGSAATIVTIKPTRVLAVLDGSPQDETTVDAATYLQGRFQTQTYVLDARDELEPNDPTAEGRSAEIPGSEVAQAEGDDSYDRILAAVETLKIDLVIIPCPFGRSFEEVGTDSAGTVIDVLLSRCPSAMLVIRRDDQGLKACSDEVAMVLGGECDVENRAAGWLFALAEKDANVSLNLVVEKEQYQNIRSIIEALDPDTTLDPQQFSDAMTKTHESIHAAMAKTAGSMNMSYQLRPLAGEEAPPNPLAESKKMLLVMPLEVDDRFGQGFVQDRIRRSPHPVLVVPGHVS